MRKRVVQFLGALVPVALGVYLAVAVDDCKGDRALRDRLDKVDEVLRNEVLQNRKVVRGNLQYHVALRDSLLVQIGTPTEAEMQGMDSRVLFKYWRGTRMSGLMHGGYEASLASGTLTEMPIAQLTHLSNLYNQQENYVYLGRQALQSVTQIGPRTPFLEAAKFFNSFTIDAYYAETQLLEAMELVLSDLDIPPDTTYAEPRLQWRYAAQ